MGRAPWNSPLPQSIRGQLTVALLALAGLIAATGLVAVTTLGAAADAARRLAEERLAASEEAQGLVHRAAIVEGEAIKLLVATSAEGTRDRYAGVVQQLDLMDGELARMGSASHALELLELHEAGQMLRNRTHVVAHLHERTLETATALAAAIEARVAALAAIGDPEADALALVLERLRSEQPPAGIAALRAQYVARAGRGRRWPKAVEADLRSIAAEGRDDQAPEDPFSRRAALVEGQDELSAAHDGLVRDGARVIEAAQALSSQFTGDYRAATERLAERVLTYQRWVVALVAGSLGLAWLVFHFVLGRHVLARLQLVSHRLRLGSEPDGSAQVTVRGADEIAEMARAVEQFLGDRQRLIEANEELRSFSYSVSHDLRAPVRHVDAFAELLRSHAGAGLDEQSRHYLDGIADAARSMGAKVDALLSFLRIRDAALKAAPVALEPLVREVVAEVAAGVDGQRPIEWIIGPLSVVMADRPLLRLAVAELVSNALKFTSGRERAEIEIGCAPSPDAGQVTLWIRDNGVGFDPRYTDKLFRVFQRLHRVEEYGGTGIGLATVRRIVDRHGGRVWADGVPGKGATFYAALPAAPPAG